MLRPSRIERFQKNGPPTEDERKAAADDEFTKIELTEKVKARANRLEGWIICKPFMVEYIVNALTEGSISIIKDKYRRDWMTSIETDASDCGEEPYSIC
jgi:hypothetical protein